MDIFSASGSLIRRLRTSADVTWDGLDNRGLQVPTGVYVARWTDGSRSLTVSLLHLSPDKRR
jgi:hypothetical protein